MYVVWEETPRAGAARIVLTSSTDGGLTWTPPRRVSSDRRTQAFTPSVAVAADGTVAVTYDDFSADRPRRRPLLTSVWFARSTNGGLTFGRRERLRPQPFDLRQAPRTDRGWFLGDYQGLVAAGGVFHALFTVVPGRLGDRTRIIATTIR